MATQSQQPEVSIHDRMIGGLVDGKLCGRRFDIFSASHMWPGEDRFRAEDASCSYCGSFHPDKLIERLEAGTVELGATDKNYKVYLHNAGGEPFKQHYRDCYSQGAKDCKGPAECTHWVTRDTSSSKFYFQHFSSDQMRRFIELMNAGKLKMHGGYGFYRLPFFVKK